MRTLESSTGGRWVIGSRQIAFIPAEYKADREVMTMVDRRLQTTTPAERAPDPNYNITVLTSTDCNLACPYCFQNTGPRPAGLWRSPRIAVSELKSGDIAVSQIVSFVKKQMETHHKDGVDLLLFGGEPLLRYDACIGLLKALAPLPLRHARITTNATLLTASRARELEAHGLEAVNVTFDGGATTHDQMRFTKSGGQTYKVILRKIEEATAASTLHWSVRVNVSHLNSHELPQLVEDLTRACEPSRCNLHLAPLRDYGFGVPNELSTVSSLAGPFKEAYGRALEAGFRIGVPTAEEVEHCAYCTAPGGVTGAVIGPDGTLYSCWDNAGKPDKAVGHVVTGYDADLVNSNRWHACSADVVTNELPSILGAVEDEVHAFILDWYREHGVALTRANTADPTLERR
ncbi:radical SAM protein [Hamadaea sp. NPDC050747]|uniref:radical SAM protein n=1 Tax=Hamadaea sp. NPDC050747 TaxID=3155789 RepID=UPI0033E171E8